MTYKTLSNHVHSTTRLTHDDILFQQRLELASDRAFKELGSYLCEKRIQKKFGNTEESFNLICLMK